MTPGRDPGEYPWAQFLRYSLYCTKIQGSALYDSALGDPELVDKIYQQLVEEQSAKRKPVEPGEDVGHPSRRGYTREVELLQDLNDNMLAFRAESGHWKASSIKFSARPLFPAEAAQEKMRARAQQRRDAGIAAGRARWLKEHGD